DDNLAKIGEQSQQLRMQVAQQGGVDQAPKPQEAPQASPAPAGAPEAQAAPGGPSYAPQPQQPPAAPQGGGLNLMDPRTQQALELLAVANPQMASAITSLGSAVLPTMDVTRSGLVFDKHTGKFVNAGPNEQGIEYNID